MSGGVLRVAVAGATGRTGSEAARALRAAEGIALVAAVARSRRGEDLGHALGEAPWDLPLESDVVAAIERTQPDVLVDFTLAEPAAMHARLALERGVRPVIGATGLSGADVEGLRRLVGERGTGAALVPNFSFGVLLLNRFCREAARYFPAVEVVESHHVAKRDRPSGTAARIARVLESAGADAPVPVHSVRLPGLVAHHEVIFGGPGETLTIRHDTLHRSSFGPGVVLAARRVMAMRGLAEDLEGLLAATENPRRASVG